MGLVAGLLGGGGSGGGSSARADSTSGGTIDMGGDTYVMPTATALPSDTSTILIIVGAVAAVAIVGLLIWRR